MEKLDIELAKAQLQNHIQVLVNEFLGTYGKTAAEITIEAKPRKKDDRFADLKITLT